MVLDCAIVSRVRHLQSGLQPMVWQGAGGPQANLEELMKAE